MKKILVASALSIQCVAASAIPLLDFDGFSDGERVDQYYAGGASSSGRIGPNYGISFTGGTIRNNAQGGYIEGGFSVSFNGAAIAAGRDYFRSSILATRWDIDGTHSFQKDSGGSIVDAIWVAGTQHPYCSSKAACDAIGATYYDRETLFGYEFNVFPEVTSISFTTHALDELWLDAAMSPARIRWSNSIKDVDGNAEVPEPYTLMLLIIGITGFIGSRQMRSERY